MTKKKVKPKKGSNTQRQQKLIKLISENLGNKNATLSMYDMMLKAGFTESSAKQQSNILAGIKDKVVPIVDAMEKERKRAMTRLSKKISDAKYRDLIDGIDKLTKNIQLLSGHATERTDVVELTDEQAEELLKRRRKE